MNIVVLRGRISSAPVVRSLASGATLMSLEVTTRLEGEAACSAPVGWFDPPRAAQFAEGDEVVVLGEVRRRFFRSAAGTQSRTEVVALEVVSATSRRRVERVLGAAAKRLGVPVTAALPSS